MLKRGKAVRRFSVLFAASVALVLVTSDAEARGGHGGRGGSHRSYHKARTTHVHIHVPKAAAAKSTSTKTAASRAGRGGNGGSGPALDCSRPDLTAEQIARCPAMPMAGGAAQAAVGR